MRLTCADLFCGAGGFSEGFRQAGFQVTKAVDVWAPAVRTHERNHPSTDAIRGDLLSYSPEELGPVDVLIGSPPCTEFSFANRGGGGDIEAGLRLVYRFLRFVYELQPRWWVMENVPRVHDFLPAEVPLRKLGVDKRGTLPIPVRTVLTSANFGVPQLRKRAFSGNFPEPQPTHRQENWRTLRDVVAVLPDPLRPGHGDVRDPVYGFELPILDLTDHFSPGLVLTEEEVRENRKAKEDHSWYGRMSFPDELDRPGRTIMATNLRVSRETTVIGTSDGRYRRLSVREASSVQGFPITYQWWANSSALKYKLVGNAVAPPVAFAIASSIVAAAGEPVPATPHVVRAVASPAPAASDRERKRALPLTRRFREHVPGSKMRGLRVDLDNRGPHEEGRLVGWRTVLFRGSGKALQHEVVGLTEALAHLDRTAPDPVSRARAKSFLQELEMVFAGVIPDANTLQQIRADRVQADLTPYVIIERAGELATRYFGGEARVVRYHAPKDPTFLPPRIAATLVATAYACALANDHPKRPRLRLPAREVGSRARPPRPRTTQATQR